MIGERERERKRERGREGGREGERGREGEGERVMSSRERETNYYRLPITLSLSSEIAQLIQQTNRLQTQSDTLYDQNEAMRDRLGLGPEDNVQGIEEVRG